MSGDIATWIVASIIAICFIFGLKKMYTNVSSGKCDSCGSNGACSGNCHCNCCNSDEDLHAKKMH